MLMARKVATRRELDNLMQELHCKARAYLASQDLVHYRSVLHNTNTVYLEGV